MAKTRWTALYTLTALMSHSIAAAEEPRSTAADIIARHLEVSGGAEAQRQFTTRNIEGTLTIAGLGKAGLTVTQKAPDKKHARVVWPDFVVEEGATGKTAWKKEPGKPVTKLEGLALQEKLRDARFYGVLEMFEQGQFTYKGEQSIDGNCYHVLEATFPDRSLWGGAHYTFYFDAKTYYLDIMKMPLTSLGEGVIATVVMGDYKMLDGIPCPFSMLVSVGKEFSMSMQFEKVTQGMEVDDSLFATPQD